MEELRAAGAESPEFIPDELPNVRETRYDPVFDKVKVSRSTDKARS